MLTLSEIRAQLPAVQQVAYFNAGTHGPLPQVVADTMVAVAQQELHEGRATYAAFDAQANHTTRLRQALADLLHVPVSTLALTHSSTEGMNVALWGLRWQPGDEVITTSLEHPGLISPLAILRQRAGITVRFVDVGYGERNRLLAGIQRAFTRRTRLVALSHVAYSSGALFPLEEVIDLARQHGAWVLVDGAQSVGAIPLDLTALGVDFYAGPGQKWLCGPDSSGMLYVNPDRLDDLLPTFGSYTVQASHDDQGYFLPALGAQRFESLTWYRPAVLGLAAAVTWLHDAVGMARVFERTAALSNLLCERLVSIPGVTVLTPAGQRAGLVNFDVQGWSPQAQAGLVTALFDQGYLVRSIPHRPYCLRAAAGFYNTEDEVLGLVQALHETIARGPQSVTIPERSKLLPAIYTGP